MDSLPFTVALRQLGTLRQQAQNLVQRAASYDLRSRLLDNTHNPPHRMKTNLAATQMSHALQGLTPEQRLKVLALLPERHISHTGNTREGWSIYRSPTTINPPTTLRLHKRDGKGRLVQVISITENGVTK